MTNPTRSLFGATAVSSTLMLFAAGCGGPLPDGSVGAEPGGAETAHAALSDSDGLATPAFMNPPFIPPELQTIFDIGKEAFPIISGLLTFLQNGPTLADQITAATTTIVNQVQYEDIKGQLVDELNWVGIIARNPCNATSLTNYSLYLSKISGTFEHIRQIVEGPDVNQSYKLAVDMNALGQIYLAMLKGSPQIGSPACGGTMTNGIAAFDQQTFNTIYREIKQTNHDLIGAEVAYLPNGAGWWIPANLSPLSTIRTSKYYASSLFAYKNYNALNCAVKTPVYSPYNQATYNQWQCYPDTGDCYCQGVWKYQSYETPNSTGCATVDEPGCVAEIGAKIDAMFAADGTISTLRAQQEQIIGVFPDAITDAHSGSSVVPAVPIPSFQEAPVAALPNAYGGFDTFFRSSTGSLIHTYAQTGASGYSQETVGTGVYGTPAAQLTPNTIELYARVAGGSVCHTQGPRNMNPFGPQWNTACDTPTNLQIFDSPATPASMILPGETPLVLGNGSGTRDVNVAIGQPAGSPHRWGASPWVGTMFSRTSPVIAALTGTSADDIFTVGLDGTVQLTMWLPAFSFGLDFGRIDTTKVVGAPNVVSWGGGRWDLFAVGRDKAVWHKAYDPNTGYLSYVSLGGVVKAKPAAVAAFGAGRLDVFVIGTDGALYQSYCSGANCSGQGAFWGWYRLGATPKGIVGNPVVVSPAYNQIDIVVVDASGKLYHIDWTGTQWTPFNVLSSIPVALN